MRRIWKLARLLAGKGCTAADFDPVYGAAADDAWNYSKNPFEKARFDIVTRTLSDVPTTKVLEVGCAEGHLTRRMAGHASDLLACDIVNEAIDRARTNCRDLRNVRFLRMDVRTGWPGEMFDLLVYSDVLYFFSKKEVRQVIGDSARYVNDGGHLLFANEWHSRYRWFTHPSFIMEQLHESEHWKCISTHDYSYPGHDRSVTVGLFRRTSNRQS